MKKIYTLLSACFSMVLLFTSCGNANEFVLKGTLGTKKGEKFLVIYDDPIAKIDTIQPIEGEFEYTFLPDTMTLIRLVNKEGKMIPIFADKGWEVECNGTFDKPILNGNVHNRDYHDFLGSIEGIENTDTIAAIAEKFIRKHPQSFASAYLIDRYFIQTENPDIKKINSLIIPLNGEVKDSHVLYAALKSIAADKQQINSTLNYFSLRDRNNKYFSWSLGNDEYILVNFWASWNEESRSVRDSLYDIAKKLPKGRLKVLNISLDYEKEQWLEACKKDTIFWTETCSFNGWETPIVKQNNILSLPSNMLIDEQRKILATDIYSSALTDSLKRMTSKNK